MGPHVSKIKHILCPTDLSDRSQQTLGFASGIAARLSAKITAIHCSPAPWFSADHRLADDRRGEIETQISQSIRGDRNGSAPEFSTSIFENSFDPARDILRAANELAVDLIVMKARKGVFSALHYGSIVERITRRSAIPVLLLPTSFLESHSAETDIDFRQVLFDYDFSESTDRLFPVAMSLTQGFEANLHLLAVLEPPPAGAGDATGSLQSMKRIENSTQQKLEQILKPEPVDPEHSRASVMWGGHAEGVLKYAELNDIDLICTTLSPAYFYYEKLYCAYLGQLLQSAKCPILALRSV